MQSGGTLLSADLQIGWEVQGSSLVTTGKLTYKLPFKDRVEHQFSGKDRIGGSSHIQMESFSFSESGGGRGGWTHVPQENKIVFKSANKEKHFNTEDDEFRTRAVLTPGAILFCALRLESIETAGLYVGAKRSYRTKFLVSEVPPLNRKISIAYSKQEALFQSFNVATLVVEPNSRKLIGGDILLPIFGKLVLRAL